MPSHDDLPRTALPMPDRPRPGLTTYDARDPETSFAPIDAAAAAGRGARTC